MRYKYSIPTFVIAVAIYLCLATSSEAVFPSNAETLLANENPEFCNSKVCEVHETDLQRDRVPIVGGLSTSPRLLNHRDLFPYSNKFYDMGCVVGGKRYAEVVYCPKCRQAESWWALTSLLGSSWQKAWKPKPKLGDAVRVLVATGGHDYDSEFYSIFDDAAINAKIDPHPRAYSYDMRKRADVLVIYDTAQSLEPAKQKNLRDFVESGKGVVVLHHGICTNVAWPWWYEEVVGGRWLFEPVNGKVGSYKHDVDLTIKPVMQHPILKGIQTFKIHDETYKDLWISPKVKVLLTTDDPTSDGPVAWVGPYEKARVVYIQLGHDRNANLNPNYQRLVRNAIQWAAGKLN